MDYGDMIGDSFEYAKEALWGKWVRWILLIVSAIIFPLYMGYVVRIYKGEKPAPELEQWGKLFIDGLKLFVIGFVYAIPVVIIFMVFAVGGLAVSGSDPIAMMAGMGLGMLLAIILAIIISLIAAIGMIRFARTDSMGQAFNFGAIMQHIGDIGWGSYIVALIVLWVLAIVFGIIIGLLAAIPFIGWLIMLFLDVAWGLFAARYMVRIYDSAQAPA